MKESIGQVLKAARERRQISVADVVAATKMTSTYVKAIEEDNFNILGAPVYARGFIKLYAGCVGLDPLPLLKQFDLSRRAEPVFIPAPAKAPPGKAAAAYAGKRKPEPGPEKTGGRSKAVSPSPLAAAAPSGARALLEELAPARLASLLAGRFAALQRIFGAHGQWARFKLALRSAGNAARNIALRAPARLPLRGIIWRRIFILALAGLLIVAAGLAWEWSLRGLPSDTDACRWLADPPAPYLDVEARNTPSTKALNIQHRTSNVE